MARCITHFVVGLFVGAAAHALFGGDLVTTLFSAAFGALLPDIDHQASFIGRRIKPVSWLAQHRGFFHSLFGAAILTGLYELILNTSGYTHTVYPAVFFAGFLSHLVLDASTKEGIQLFYPAKKRIKGKRTTGSFLEWLFLLIMSVFTIMLLFIGSREAISENHQSVVLLSFDTELVDSPEMVRTVLDMLDKHDARATFFVMGAFAEANPELVKEIAKKHEVASHTMTHPRLTKTERTDIMTELKDSKELLEKITGRPVVGFRAPYNAINKETYTILNELNYEYDASTFKNYKLFSASPKKDSDIQVIPVSNWALLPLEDYPLVTYLRLNKRAFTLMSWKHGPVISLDLHPRIVAKYPEAFDEMLTRFEERGAAFMSHEEFSQMNNN